MFNNKKDPLADAVRKVMEGSMLRHPEQLDEGKGSKQEREIKRDEAPKATDKKDVDKIKKRITKTTGYVFKEEAEQLDERLKAVRVKAKGDETKARSLRTPKGGVRIAKHKDGSWSASSKTGDWESDGGDRTEYPKIKSDKRRAVKSVMSAARDQLDDMNEGVVQKVVKYFQDRKDAKDRRKSWELESEMNKRKKKLARKGIRPKYSPREKPKMDRRLKVNKHPIARGKSVPLVNEGSSFESIQEEIRKNLQAKLVEAYGNEEKFNAFVDNLTEEQIEILGIKSDE